MEKGLDGVFKATGVKKHAPTSSRKRHKSKLSPIEEFVIGVSTGLEILKRIESKWQL